jgi:hypothetical protein
MAKFAPTTRPANQVSTALPISKFIISGTLSRLAERNFLEWASLQQGWTRLNCKSNYHRYKSIIKDYVVSSQIAETTRGKAKKDRYPGS